ncbi:hypothetical protein CC80DRAFT_585101 [Byssothecium circinans]|uniref:Xylanolytic transcriptional activator regulatory domain-containing protein n=1 Tax=Byssothecium circinans TaxID=147558 RepID=A0A6A5THI3_9PLEO|nr:hypothetical protein CC80DRAFT_585101 [Byssothecium circinans]
MFGQSHWINSCVILCLEVIKLVEEYARDDSASVVTGLQRCKHFARQIKTQRTPQWPCTPTPELPPKAIADELLECYLRTSESLYRVLHVPSFLSQYETVWIDNAASDPTFLVLLKLVLAIGAASYNDTFTLRPSAIRWVYEAEAWLANPTLKHRLGLQYFQIYCLLVLARESTAVGEDLVWISTGGLFRAAVHMGLHRDPAHFPPRSHFANEMHRRIWNTIIELCLQASLNHGGPPLMSLADFDTNPPSNFNDDQLTEKHALPRPESQHTQASIAIALRKTYPIRLAITKFLNCIGTASSYDETLRLDAEFRQSYKGLRSAFQGFNCTSDRTASQVALRLADVILQRYLTALHMPFYGSALNDSAHAYSRKVALDASLKVWYAMNPLSDAMHSEGPLEEGILGRLCICASGFLRISVLQALLLASVELRQQVKDDDGFGPVPLRRDLLAIVQDGKTWHLKCVEAGETNIKGYIFAVLLCANIEGLMKGLERPELAAFLISHAHEAELQCFEILKNMLDQSQPEQNIESLGQMSLETTPGSLEGWDFMVSGAAPFPKPEFDYP